MKRFFYWVLVFFGIFLTIQTVRLAVREKDMAKVNVKQFKNKIIYITAPDIFAEKNIMDVFKSRYGATLKFKFKNKNDEYLTLDSDADAIIYPSFVYEKLYSANKLNPIDVSKVHNVNTLMEDTKIEIKQKYSKTDAFAVPLAYVPYAMFFYKDQLKQSTSGKEIISLASSIALSDDVGSILTVFKIFNLPLKEKSVVELKKIFKGKKIFFYNADDPIAMEKTIKDAQPQLIIGPSFNSNIFERVFSRIDMILPEEGTYANYYLVSFLKNNDAELMHVFLNHIIEPLIQRNLIEVMGIGITNYNAMKNIKPVLYNTLKMNDSKYLKNMFILKDEEEYKTATKLFIAIKS